MLAGVLDLVTGVPLVQENDFELPFGGAVFRHIRTYSEGTGIAGPTWMYREGDYWDWQGHRWMMSENPIFLIDAGQYDLVGDHNPICYFVPDAHHSIPFQLQHDEATQTTRYVAPPYIDAVLSHNGSGWNNSTKTWGIIPTKFTVYLDRGAIKYTIDAQYHIEDGHFAYDDLYHYVNEDGLLGSIHDRPDFANGMSSASGGEGLPAYGLVTKIEDRFGNRVEMEYCAPVQTDFNDPETPCKECLQNCTEKGQLRAVRLYAAGSQDPTWTLAYVHRNFWRFGQLSGPPHESADGRRWRGENYLHAIYVYEGAPALPSGCFTLDGQQFFDQKDTFDQIDAIDAVAAFGLPTNWVKQARYVYTEDGRPDGSGAEFNQFGNPEIFQRALESATMAAPPCLLKATVVHRESGIGESKTSDTSLYRYQPDGGEDPGLFAVYRPDAVRKILEGTWSFTPTPPANLPVTSSRLNQIMDLPEGGTTISFSDPPADYPNGVPLEALASVRLEERGNISGFEYTDLCEEFVDHYIHANHNTLLPLVAQGSHNRDIVSVDGTAGSVGHYRIWRFLNLPAAGIVAPGATALSTAQLPLRSIYHAPYYWQPNAGEAQVELPSPSLDQATWINVIDQFPTLSEARGASATNGQLHRPMSRRVVQINAAGYVVKSREWTFDLDGNATTTANMGLVEEYQYESFVYEEPGTERNVTYRDFRLREKYTLGSVAAELQSQQAAEGLVYRYGYADDLDPNARPRSREIVSVAAKKGLAGSLVPISDFERDAVRKDLVTIERKYGDAQSPGEVAEIVERSYTLGQPTTGPNSEPIVEKLVKRARTALSPADIASPQYYAVEKEHFDEQGRRDWRGYGTISNPAQPGSDTADRFFLDHWQYDDRGRLVCQIQDVEPDQSGNVYARRGTAAAHAYAVGAPPTGFARAVPTGESIPPLNYVTAFEYNEFGQTACYYPNGQADYTIYIQLTPEKLQTRKYPKVTYTYVGGQGEFRGINGVWVMDYEGSQPEQMVQASLQNVTLTLPVTGAEQIAPLSTTTPTFDSAGRITSIRTEGQDGSTVGASLGYDPFGAVAREQGADGTVTRRVHDPLGRLERVFRGTKDAHDQWNTAITSQNDDNMVLLEKHAYGEGFNDAGKLVSTRRMREKPSNQYGVAGPSFEGSNEDDYGWLEIRKYDWRMREVWVEHPLHRVHVAVRPRVHLPSWLELFAPGKHEVPAVGRFLAAADAAVHPRRRGEHRR